MRDARLLIISICLLFSSQVFSEIDYDVMNMSQHRIHLIKFDPNAFDIHLVQASPKKAGHDTLLNIARDSRALVAINAGFFHLNQEGVATPSGALKIKGDWKTYAAIPRAALGWSQTHTLIDNLRVRKTKQGAIIDPLHSKKEAWQKLDYIVGGVPLLVRQGRVTTQFDIEKITADDFLSKPHARTAVGITSDNHWIIVVVEQRYTLNSEDLDFQLAHDYVMQKNFADSARFKAAFEISTPGLTIQELAHFMKSLGCVYAINLDGGGSSGLYYQGRMRTRLFESENLSLHRPIHTAIVIRPKS